MKRFLSALLLGLCLLLGINGPALAFDYDGTLGTGLTASTNPDPNTLGTVAPLASTVTSWRGNISTDWTTQNKPALFPLPLRDQSGERVQGGERPIRLHFVPSAGSGTTYTVTIWFFNPQSQTWSKPYDTPSLNLTGEQVTYINLPGSNPIFIQLSSICSGTVSVYYDRGVAEKG